MVDPNPTNNSAPGQITVNCIGTSDVKIVDQNVVAPSNIPVSEDVPITVEKILHNNGPWGPVQVEMGAVVDRVNIGYDGAADACNAAYSADEVAHAADGWGHSVEPACTGGNYGGGSDDGNSRLTWHPSDGWDGSALGPGASVTMNSGGFQLGTLRVNVLDGMAGIPIPNDSFEVYVNGSPTPIYTYHGSNPVTAEIWVVHSIDLVTPANSHRQPEIPGSSIETGAGIDPSTTSVLPSLRAVKKALAPCDRRRSPSTTSTSSSSTKT